MISKHCGKRLVRLTPDVPRSDQHIWQCSICKREFRQRVRMKVEQAVSNERHASGDWLRERGYTRLMDAALLPKGELPE